MKHYISSPNFYKLPIKIEPKQGTTLDAKSFYNNIKNSINAGTNMKEYIILPFKNIICNTTSKVFAT